MSLRLRAFVSPLAFGALLALVPEVASAQITPFVAHPRKPADTTTRQPPVAEARPDTSRRARSAAARRAEITNMKAWVDSAAIAAGTRIPLPLDSARLRQSRRSIDTTFIAARTPFEAAETPVVAAETPVIAAETPVIPAETPAVSSPRTWADRPVRESMPMTVPSPAPTPARVPVPGPVPAEDEGLVAPDTATSLPTLLLGGLVATMVGLSQLRRRR